MCKTLKQEVVFESEWGGPYMVDPYDGRSFHLWLIDGIFDYQCNPGKILCK
jgi:hypothetical protein